MDGWQVAQWIKHQMLKRDRSSIWSGKIYSNNLWKNYCWQNSCLSCFSFRSADETSVWKDFYKPDPISVQEQVQISDIQNHIEYYVYSNMKMSLFLQQIWRNVASTVHQWTLQWISLKYLCSEWVVSYKHSFSLLKTFTDGLDWCGLLEDYCDVFISSLDSHSDGTHSLQCISKSAQMKKQTHLHLGYFFLYVQQDRTLVMCDQASISEYLQYISVQITIVFLFIVP